MALLISPRTSTSAQKGHRLLRSALHLATHPKTIPASYATPQGLFWSPDSVQLEEALKAAVKIRKLMAFLDGAQTHLEAMSHTLVLMQTLAERYKSQELRHVELAEINARFSLLSEQLHQRLTVDARHHGKPIFRGTGLPEDLREDPTQTFAVWISARPEKEFGGLASVASSLCFGAQIRVERMSYALKSVVRTKQLVKCQQRQLRSTLDHLNWYCENLSAAQNLFVSDWMTPNLKKSAEIYQVHLGHLVERANLLPDQVLRRLRVGENIPVWDARSENFHHPGLIDPEMGPMSPLQGHIRSAPDFRTGMDLEPVDQPSGKEVRKD